MTLIKLDSCLYHNIEVNIMISYNHPENEELNKAYLNQEKITIHTLPNKYVISSLQIRNSLKFETYIYDITLRMVIE